MRKLAIATVVGISLLAGALTACGKESSDGDSTTSAAASTAASSMAPVTLPGSATFTAMQSRGKVIIGVKEDQPGLGYKDPTTGKYSGFDIEIANYIAEQLGFPTSKIEYKAIPSANRETSIKAGEIDYYVGTYSITDSRKTSVSFAGPYYVAGQDLLVRKDDTTITGQDTLAGKKICSVTGSTPAKRLKDQGLPVLELEKYSLCVDQLLNKQVDTVTTDDAILKGYAAQSPDKLKVVGKPFSTEKYGIGLNLDDSVLRGKINDLLEASRTNGKWQSIYDNTLGKSGSSATQPQLERY